MKHEFDAVGEMPGRLIVENVATRHREKAIATREQECRGRRERLPPTKRRHSYGREEYRLSHQGFSRSGIALPANGGTGSLELAIQRNASSCAYTAASVTERKVCGKRNTRSVVAEPDPERIDTELAKQPCPTTLIKGEIRNLPTRLALVNGSASPSSAGLQAPSACNGGKTVDAPSPDRWPGACGLRGGEWAASGRAPDE
jgi:hypothetical protein